MHKEGTPCIMTCGLWTLARLFSLPLYIFRAIHIFALRQGSRSQTHFSSTCAHTHIPVLIYLYCTEYYLINRDGLTHFIILLIGLIFSLFSWYESPQKHNPTSSTLTAQSASLLPSLLLWSSIITIIDLFPHTKRAEMPSLVAATPRVFRVNVSQERTKINQFLGFTLFISDLLMHNTTKGQLEVTRDGWCPNRSRSSVPNQLPSVFFCFFFLNPIRLFMSDSQCRTNSEFMYSLLVVCLLAVQQIASQRILNIS